MKLSAAGLNLIKDFEKFTPSKYKDAKGYSIGYGHYILPGENFSTITQAQALALLAKDVLIAESAINRLVKAPLNQSQFDVLVSLVFNIGSGNFSTSTVLKRINAGDYAGAAAAFAMWNKSDGEVKQNLIDRRAIERAHFLGGGGSSSASPVVLLALAVLVFLILD